MCAHAVSFPPTSSSCFACSVWVSACVRACVRARCGEPSSPPTLALLCCFEIWSKRSRLQIKAYSAFVNSFRNSFGESNLIYCLTTSQSHAEGLWSCLISTPEHSRVNSHQLAWISSDTLSCWTEDSFRWVMMDKVLAVSSTCPRCGSCGGCGGWVSDPPVRKSGSQADDDPALIFTTSGASSEETKDDFLFFLPLHHLCYVTRRETPASSQITWSLVTMKLMMMMKTGELCKLSFCQWGKCRTRQRQTSLLSAFMGKTKDVPPRQTFLSNRSWQKLSSVVSCLLLVFCPLTEGCGHFWRLSSSSRPWILFWSFLFWVFQCWIHV